MDSSEQVADKKRDKLHGLVVGILVVVLFACSTVFAGPAELPCPDGWTPEGRTCYNLLQNTGPVTFDDANKNCLARDDRATLVKIESEAGDEEVKEFIKDTVNNGHEKLRAWIGLKCDGENGSWIDDTPWIKGASYMGKHINCEDGRCVFVEISPSDELKWKERECDLLGSTINSILCGIEFNCKRNNPCKNGAKCIFIIKGLECECVEGFTGKNCEEDIDECKSGGHDCVQENTANCTNTRGSFRCYCKPDFVQFGETCGDKTSSKTTGSPVIRTSSSDEDNTSVYAVLGIVGVILVIVVIVGAIWCYKIQKKRRASQHPKVDNDRDKSKSVGVPARESVSDDSTDIGDKEVSESPDFDEEGSVDSNNLEFSRNYP